MRPTNTSSPQHKILSIRNEILDTHGFVRAIDSMNFFLYQINHGIIRWFDRLAFWHTVFAGKAHHSDILVWSMQWICIGLVAHSLILIIIIVSDFIQMRSIYYQLRLYMADILSQALCVWCHRTHRAHTICLPIIEFTNEFQSKKKQQVKY